MVYDNYLNIWTSFNFTFLLGGYGLGGFGGGYGGGYGGSYGTNIYK